jgi:prolyl-tRNA synthetase
MRISQYYIPTLRETPSDAEVTSHKLMLRAGMIKKVAAGIYSYLPLGLKVIRKIEDIVRKYMNEAGAIELLMPAVVPSELWKESGRWYAYGKELLRLKDRHAREFCFGPTHEEVITDIVRNDIKSYKQLPVNLYQIQTKFRDEIRPRFGLMRGREFIMKDAYSFDIDNDGAEVSYNKMKDAYCKIFEACGLKYKMVDADSGAIGGSFSHEFMVLADTGEDFVISCNSCNYSANLEKAAVVDEPVENFEELLPVEEVLTLDQKTVDDVASFLNMPKEKIVKTMVLKADDKVIGVMIRGDHELNIIKVKNYLNASLVEFASKREIEEVSDGPMGYTGPINLKCKIYADNAIKYMKNYVVGGNKKDLHLLNVNHERDFDIAGFGDFRSAKAGDKCPECENGFYQITKGIEVGHIFKLGTKYSESMNCVFLDKEGKTCLMIMGCYGIGIGRTAAAAIEQNHDEKGIIWPVQLAPFEVIIIQVNTNDPKVVEVSNNIYEKLKTLNIDVAIDDRDERAGVKFNDADLIGYPVRVNVGRRSLVDGFVEINIRKTNELIKVNLDEVEDRIQKILKDLRVG